MTKRKSRNYKNEFKREAVKLVTEQGYSVAEDAQNLGVNPNLSGLWKKKSEQPKKNVHFYLTTSVHDALH